MKGTGLVFNRWAIIVVGCHFAVTCPEASCPETLAPRWVGWRHGNGQ